MTNPGDVVKFVEDDVSGERNFESVDGWRSGNGGDGVLANYTDQHVLVYDQRQCVGDVVEVIPPGAEITDYGRSVYVD